MSKIVQQIWNFALIFWIKRREMRPFLAFLHNSENNKHISYLVSFKTLNMKIHYRQYTMHHLQNHRWTEISFIGFFKKSCACKHYMRLYAAFSRKHNFSEIICDFATNNKTISTDISFLLSYIRISNYNNFQC